jgi:hypothetical protein
MRAKRINEDWFDDPGNQKALAGYTRAYVTGDLDEYVVTVPAPFTITVNSTDKAKLDFVFSKYRVKYTIKPAGENETVSENLKFSDGMEFDTSGPIHAEQREDGWYVVGGGMLIPVDSEEEANEFISRRH